MQSKLEHSTVWYMLMNALEKHSGSVFTDCWKTEAVCHNQKSWYPPIGLCGSVTHKRVLNLSILRFPCIISLCVTTK